MFAGHLLGIGWTQRFLIACGFSICGAPRWSPWTACHADEEEVLTAVALVVIFGTAMIPLIPLLSNMIGLTDVESGLWAGGSIHEVAQVVATGGAIGGGALAVAVVVKLARVIMLAPVIAVVSARPEGSTAMPTMPGAHPLSRCSCWHSWASLPCAPPE